MKTTPTFSYSDEPEYCIEECREYIAHLFRHFRKKENCSVKKISVGKYAIYRPTRRFQTIITTR